MKHEWHIARDNGIRFWIAWALVRLAFRVKNTCHWQVIATPGGSRVLVEGDAFGGGVRATVRVRWDDENGAADWPVLREFDDHDAALDWMYETGDTA